MKEKSICLEGALPVAGSAVLMCRRQACFRAFKIIWRQLLRREAAVPNSE